MSAVASKVVWSCPTMRVTMPLGHVPASFWHLSGGVEGYSVLDRHIIRGFLLSSNIQSFRLRYSPVLLVFLKQIEVVGLSTVGCSPAVSTVYLVHTHAQTDCSP